MYTDTAYKKCPASGRINIHLEGDDKVWCPACRTSHLVETMEASTEAEFDKQFEKKFLKNQEA